jgi:hypothetical protein
VVHAPTVEINSIRKKRVTRGFGAFCEHPPRPFPQMPSIIVAGTVGLYLRYLSSYCEMCTETLIHELVHYEQWRDGVVPHHRGIERRVRSLMRKTGLEGKPR